MLPIFYSRFRLKPLCALSLLALTGCAAGYHHQNGLNAMDKGEYVEAVQELQQAAELEPQDVRFRTDWLNNREAATRRLLAQAETALAAGKPAEAEALYRTILKFERDNARAQAGLERINRLRLAADDAGKAREALNQGDTALAMKLSSRSLDNAPGLAEALAVKREIEALQAKDMLAAPSLSSLYKKPINLEFRDASIKMVFEALSRTTGINFIFDREVKNDQRTTVFLRQTTLEDAIDVILTTNQLDKKILNNTSVLIYPNNANKAKEYQDLVVKAFYLNSAEAKQTAALLKTVLKIKDVFVDDKLNLLILREAPETIALAEKLIALHDLDEPEVMLEVEVLEVNRSRLLDLGIKVTDQLTITPLTNAFSGSDGTSSIRLSDLKHLNSDKLGVTLPSATVSFRKEDGDANLLANPRIRVRDREKAKILIGDKVPVVTTTTTPNGFLSENIQYLEVGLKLDVEPDVHVRDEIGLKIGLEVSSLVGTVKTNNGSQAYQIGTRNANTVLRLKDGETQVMAGLISDEDRSAANRIPLLGDLPMLGRLFSSQKDDRKKTEIVLSITPHLVRNIQRKEPAAESFWSGTEASLRTKPLQLRSIEAAPTATTPKPAAAANPPAPAANTPATPVAPEANAGGVKLNWQGPSQAKVGENITLELRLDSPEALRAAPVQFAYNPSEFEVVAVKEGDYFSKAGKANFSQLVDKPSGRVSIGLASGEASGAKGNGRLFSVELKPLKPQPEAEVSLIAMTPVGGQQAVARPNLPLSHKIAIAQ